MDEPPEHEVVFTANRRDACLERRLVLDAVGIPAEAVHDGGTWHLVVNRDHRTEAVAELQAYAEENARHARRRIVRVPTYGGAGTGVTIYAASLLLIATLAARRVLGLDWLEAGRMQAEQVLSGEWWRAFTALTLHLDAGHLLSNLVFGSVFGLLAGRILGGGLAWLAIILAGACGNFMNAAVRPPTHASIGASTAIFAALGLIVSHALRPREDASEKRLKRWSPLIGGVVLLAFTGVGGERTDVAAHVTGFLAGLVIGWLGARLPNHWLGSRAFQQSAGLLTVVLLALAWTIALLTIS